MLAAQAASIGGRRSAREKASAMYGSCEVCGAAGRTLNGTYQTIVIGQQGCYFQIELSNPPPSARTDTIVGVVAFEGRQLLFLSST